MAPTTTNWLSFSLSPMEMLRSSSESQFMSYETSSAPSPHYLIDNFYANGWADQKDAQVITSTTMAESCILTGLIDPESQHQQAPKLEDFLGDSSPVVRYSDNSQTETQDSSLTHIYDQGSATAYFSEQQDLKAIAGFQAFSNNSGSEVDDSPSIARTQLQGTEFVGHSVESAVNELGFSSNANNALSLGVNNDNNIRNNQGGSAAKAVVSVESSGCNKKITETFGQRTSIYRGVTRHRWTGRYEAHLWDNSCRREGQARKGRQDVPPFCSISGFLFLLSPGSRIQTTASNCSGCLGLTRAPTFNLGGYDKEEKAARAYDLAALKYWGCSATTNYPVTNYTKELEEMKYVSKQEFIASLRRKSSGFSRGASIYRGVTRHHQQGRWQARIGRVAGNKDLYLGTFATEEEAAEAYDIAAIKFRGMNAVTNFEMSRYDVEAIMKSSLPIGGAAKRLKLSLESEQKPALNIDDQQLQCSNNCSSNSNSNNKISFAAIEPVPNIPCGIPFDASTALYHPNLFHHHPHIQTTNSYGATSDSPGTTSSLVAPMSLMPQAAEFFIWPHQSY
ncbi:hypothetical protein Tsubulata_002669 [Turnera subulata]|uniref:AP2/ERF domain-containing protein n=1 Tax=Turnera subulata TaxID=218843 RepID=A0A9Q0J287_9ROSI|nr:hypothetical protein Tsubulata_002669 [Turnera subulata]